jgi:peptidoglycan/LPS O-acetylase OafA/YrhL
MVSHLLIVESKYSHTPILPDETRFGAFGVDMFFVISGFIMVTIARDGAWAPFPVGRAKRILPPYWFYTTLVLLDSLYAPGAVNSSFAHPPSLWRSYLLIPDTVDRCWPWAGRSYTKCIFYLCFAFMLALAASCRLALAPVRLAWAVVVVDLTFQNLGVHDPIAIVVAHPLTLEFVAGPAAGILVRRKRLTLAGPALVAGFVLLPAVLALPTCLRHSLPIGAGCAPSSSACPVRSLSTALRRSSRAACRRSPTGSSPWAMRPIRSTSPTFSCCRHSVACSP